MSLAYRNTLASRTALYNRKSMKHRTDENKHYQTQTQRSQETQYQKTQRSIETHTKTKQRGVGKNGHTKGPDEKRIPGI